ncbi:AlpA family phage regulatory protein [Herbaspirillum sp. C7C2]|uniref:helix-turn-helix transcriptional regulator n=1 Tax=Herbaspirillum sp. C7C2 TaxID=2736666 RepID=UPI00406C7CB9|nr:AlpA family phage regulatory protein [Herbaspirillum sp. C7C2]
MNHSVTVSTAAPSNPDRFGLPHRLIVRKQILSILNVSRTTLWRIMANDTTFPQPVTLNTTKSQWILSEVLAWAEGTRTTRAN